MPGRTRKADTLPTLCAVFWFKNTFQDTDPQIDPLSNGRRNERSLSQVEPELSSSGMIFEAYSLHAVQQVPAASTAFPDRENGLLIAAVMLWNASALTPAETASFEERAACHGGKMRDAVVKGSGGKLHAYVNYASGEEGLEAMYGYEGWRLDTCRLRALKGKYDPLERFSWYAPIE